VATPEQPVTDTGEQSARIRREVIQLVVLTIVAVCAFLLTRAVATANRRTSLSDAARWYEKGQAGLAAGRIDEAIDAFHRAMVRNRAEQRYGLALAGALAAKAQDTSARQILLALREAAPDSSEINVQLARLAAKGADVREAVRYYHNALYAPGASEHPRIRRQLRVELVRLLLAHGQASRGLAELLALSADLPDEAAPHTEAGQLFAQAGDERRALDQFQRALRIAPAEDEALAGAGMAAASLGEYGLAQKYLASLSAETDALRETRDMVQAVVTRDPLAPRLRSSERLRRARANLSYAANRFEACRPAPTTEPADDADRQLQEAAHSFEVEMKRPGTRDQDAIERGVELASRLAVRVGQTCAPATALDRALVLIGQRHGIEP
jgi:tetratricopeptide (TPR) repeat protein